MTDCCAEKHLLPLDEAKHRLKDTMQPITETECVDLDDALNRTVAVPVVSTINVPGHNNSAMDGYAVRDQGLHHHDRKSLSGFHVVGTSLAGKPFNGKLKSGQAIRIMTGALVPDDADAVVMQENVSRQDDFVELNKPIRAGDCIRLAGEDISKGEVILQKGHKISSVDVGLLASLGIARLTVFRKLKVAVFSTGDELKIPGESLTPGDIYESNRPVLINMLRKAGVHVLDFGIIEDSESAIRQAFLEADAKADVVISSGGVSVGDADYTKSVLNEIGQIDFWKVAIKPGKPFAFGRLPASYFFGLPGNPVSAMVTFHQLVLDALRALSGTEALSRLRFPARTMAPIRKAVGRTEFQRGIATRDAQGALQVVPLTSQGSGILSSMNRANCYIVLDAEQGSLDIGQPVSIECFDSGEI